MSNKVSSGGTSLFGVLILIFITLKIVGIQPIDSWPWFSLNPFTGSVLMFAITWPLWILGIIFVVAGIVFLVETSKGGK